MKNNFSVPKCTEVEKKKWPQIQEGNSNVKWEKGKVAWGKWGNSERCF